MTPYGHHDLEEDWEFKILRSATGAFKSTERMERVLEEEAQSGWVLVEKFDNGRIRLKRRAGQHPSIPGIDAYRTNIGLSETRIGLLVAALIIGVTAFIGVLVVILER